VSFSSTFRHTFGSDTHMTRWRKLIGVFLEAVSVSTHFLQSCCRPKCWEATEKCYEDDKGQGQDRYRHCSKSAHVSCIFVVTFTTYRRCVFLPKMTSQLISEDSRFMTRAKVDARARARLLPHNFTYMSPRLIIATLY
jgi:hypothetical protein